MRTQVELGNLRKVGHASSCAVVSRAARLRRLALVYTLEDATTRCAFGGVVCEPPPVPHFERRASEAGESAVDRTLHARVELNASLLRLPSHRPKPMSVVSGSVLLDRKSQRASFTHRVLDQKAVAALPAHAVYDVLGVEARSHAETDVALNAELVALLRDP